MHHSLLKPMKFVLRWGIAAAGIYYIISSISLPDRVMIASPADGWPVLATVVGDSSENAASFQIMAPLGDSVHAGMFTVNREQLLVRPDLKQIRIREGGQERKVEVLALQVRQGLDRRQWPLIVTTPRGLWQRYWKIRNGSVRRIESSEIIDPYEVQVPYPVLEIGMSRMVREANAWLLALSLAVFPITVAITALRWKRLMEAVEINISFTKAFSLNMVGLFYNTFIPAGSTGGDVLKAYYASRHTTHKVRAVMTVVVDRIIGLVVLIILGGILALGFYLHADKSDRASQACLHVALGSGAILTGMTVGLTVFANARLRRATGLAFVLTRLPMQKQISHAMETMAIYRQRPGLVLWAMIVTVPVHVTVMMAAMLAGKAFHLPLTTGYYFVIVPVIVLAGAIPISPQGAGVMELFAIPLTAQQGATVAQAFALTMSIRLQQIFWNLVGGIFVATGHYRSQQKSEKDAEADLPKVPSPPG